MKRIVVLGATSEVAQHTQRILARSGAEFLLVARSAARLEAVAADLRVRGAARVLMLTADFLDFSSHSRVFAFAQENFADFDCVFLAYGTLLDQLECRRSAELSLSEWAANFSSPAAILTRFANHFEERRSGCIAAITSVAGDRGRASNYIYGSAKGGLSIFLQGLRARLHGADVRVLTIKLGPVQTPMTHSLRAKRPFADPGQVARRIARALQSSSDGVLYVPGYWRYVMGAIKLVPESVFKRLPL